MVAGPNDKDRDIPEQFLFSVTEFELPQQPHLPLIVVGSFLTAITINFELLALNNLFHAKLNDEYSFFEKYSYFFDFSNIIIFIQLI